MRILAFRLSHGLPHVAFAKAPVGSKPDARKGSLGSAAPDGALLDMGKEQASDLCRSDERFTVFLFGVPRHVSGALQGPNIPPAIALRVEICRPKPLRFQKRARGVVEKSKMKGNLADLGGFRGG